MSFTEKKNSESRCGLLAYYSQDLFIRTDVLNFSIDLINMSKHATHKNFYSFHGLRSPKWLAAWQIVALIFRNDFRLQRELKLLEKGLNPKYGLSIKLRNAVMRLLYSMRYSTNANKVHNMFRNILFIFFCCVYLAG